MRLVAEESPDPAAEQLAPNLEDAYIHFMQSVGQEFTGTVMGDLGLRLHARKRCIGKLSNGFDFLGYRVVPGRRLRTSAEGRRRFAEKFMNFELPRNSPWELAQALINF